MFVIRAALILIAIVLTGCAAGPRNVGADVRTSAALPPGSAVLQGARYRFERGPVIVGQPAPEKLEAMAQPALARVGVLRDDLQATVSVQVGGMVNAYWRDPWGGASNASVALGLGYGWRGGGIGFGYGAPLYDPDIPVYLSEVSLLMRDLKSGQIVYDTRARHDGTWSDTDQVLVALFAAALEGYPQPAQAVRRVSVPLIPPAPPPAPVAPATPAR